MVAYNGPIRRVGLAGAHGVGKTRAILESPYSPILLIDLDDGSRPFMPYFEFERILVDEAGSVLKVIDALKKGEKEVVVPFGEREYTYPLLEKYGTIGVDTWASYQAIYSDAYFDQVKRGKDAWKATKQSAIVWGGLKKNLAAHIHELGRYCNLLVITSHLRQMFDNDGRPVTGVKEAVFYDRVWQTLDLVGFMTRAKNTPVPKVTFRPPLGKSRLPAMPPDLKAFSWAEVFKHSVAELELDTPEERRTAIEDTLKAFKELVGEK